MLAPETTPHVINYLINHPSIQPYVCGELAGQLDITVLLQNTDNIFFSDEVSGCGFIKLGPGRYELHSFSLPEGRGRQVKKGFEQVRDWMWSHTDCTEIVTMVPVNNRMARGAARMTGFKKYGTLEKAWKFGGEVFDIDLYVLYKGVE